MDRIYTPKRISRTGSEALEMFIAQQGGENTRQVAAPFKHIHSQQVLENQRAPSPTSRWCLSFLAELVTGCGGPRIFVPPSGQRGFRDYPETHQYFYPTRTGSDRLRSFRFLAM
jgi:hypothetical protein